MFVEKGIANAHDAKSHDTVPPDAKSHNAIPSRLTVCHNAIPHGERSRRTSTCTSTSSPKSQEEEEESRLVLVVYGLRWVLYLVIERDGRGTGVVIIIPIGEICGRRWGCGIGWVDSWG